SRDWSQVRPEWGLAGCAAFIAAPRHRTEGVDLGGRSFLHSYDWQSDENFGVLELILTAPVVVASWISLQYYGSTVDNEVFGSGNKVLHNVTGTIGVLEGTGGDLRTGLPWQSVHDGETLIHEPLRLSVYVEAPTEAMTAISGANQGVRDLLDNGWLHLFALGEDGAVAARYSGDLKWTPEGADAAKIAA
ncbi:MAG: putative inorganic carbon transporter subunit DabA, partial [Pseudomonadota bacterium]